ncbi:MAG TPA: SDR family oxidoreductase [Arenimonas sp.]|uniref:NAD-dependent epimerase/dehydratase family protein n=1 Tax=Arenimonas sp. TaxID=1872635 RepID=UPI002D80824F|nr:SDR family oxidoreductase [Arenimonas sp.]HEU0153894.1 SDR family oxidoreductase [Arenimonas sp.]
MSWASLATRPDFLPAFDAWAKLPQGVVAVTGARGTLGRLLTRRLGEAGVGYSEFEGDIREQSEVQRWIAATRPSLVIHLAAVVPTGAVSANPAHAMQVNAAATVGLVDAISRLPDPAWLFHASSSHVYAPVAVGNGPLLRLREDSPLSPGTYYGATKLAAEKIVEPLSRQLSVPACIGRVFSFFHESQPESYLVPGLFARARAPEASSGFPVHDADAVRDFLYADWVIDAILHLAAMRVRTTVNIASGDGTTVGEMARRVLDHAGSALTIEPRPAENPGALVADVGRLRQAIGR